MVRHARLVRGERRGDALMFLAGRWWGLGQYISSMEINLDSGEILMRHTVEGEAYPNDVTVGDDGVVYVSDSRYSKVYVLQDGSLRSGADALEGLGAGGG